MLKPQGNRGVSNPFTFSGVVQKASRCFKAIDSSATAQPYIWIGCLSFLYLVSTVRLALAKPLWFDELFTFYISKLPSVSAILRAAPFDSHPPGMYLLTHLSQQLFGRTDFATRAPEILSFWAMCFCLYLIARRHCSPLIAMLAFVIPLAPAVSPFTPAYYFAYEARPYGLILGLTAIAVLSWQAATVGSRRQVGLWGLALSLGAAAYCHYYALLQAVFPLVVAEAARSVSRRKIDYSLWAALGFPVLVTAWLLPQIRAESAVFKYVHDSPLFWAKPSIARLLAVYPHLMAGATLYVLVALGCLALARLLTGPAEVTPTNNFGSIPTPNIILASSFVLVPMVIGVIAFVRTGYFMDRYAVTAIIGITLLICYVLSSACSRFTGSVLAISYIAAQSLLTCAYALTMRPHTNSTSLANFMVPHDSKLALVISNPLEFLPIARYGTADLISQAVYVTDLSIAFKQKDFLPEYSLTVATPLFPLTVERYSSFLAKHERFWLFYSGHSEIEWLPARLRMDHHKLELMDQSDNNILYLVTRQ